MPLLAMAKSAARAPRNREVARGVGRLSRSRVYHKRGLWAIKAKHAGSFPTHPKKEEAAAPAEAKAPRFYPAEHLPQPLRNRHAIKKTKLRASITPGTVLILLAGHFKGKRVVFLKQLDSGRLLITGPFKLNGVPLRRVNQAYVIATSTKLDFSSVDVSKISDAYFKKEEKKKQKGENEFFEAEKEEKQTLPAEKKEDQKAVDSKLLSVIESIPDMKSYLSARFSLKSGVKPHELVF